MNKTRFIVITSLIIFCLFWILLSVPFLGFFLYTLMFIAEIVHEVVGYFLPQCGLDQYSACANILTWVLSIGVYAGLSVLLAHIIYYFRVRQKQK